MTALNPNKKQELITERFRRNKRTVFALALILFAITLSRVSKLTAFGLYEDDYTRIPFAMASNWFEVIKEIWSLFTSRGIPFHRVFIYTLSYVGNKVAGLPGIYAIGFIIITINAWLFYFLLRRIGSFTIAMLGCLAFALYFADTTQIFLTHSLGIQPSITFFLLASHLYVSGHRFSPYVLITGSLLTYETVFPLFFGIPFLKFPWGIRLRGAILRNTLFLSFIFVAVVAMRWIMGESRIVGIDDTSSVLITSIQHMAIGPMTALGTYALRPIQMLGNLSAEVSWAVIVSFGLFSFSLFRIIPFTPAIHSERFSLQLPELLNSVKSSLRDGTTQLFLAGMLFLILAYPITFTIRPYAISGRATRVHFAGVVGASIIIGCLLSWIWEFFSRWNYRRHIAILLGALYASLVGFGVVVQQDYAESWLLQKEFWRQIVSLSSDAANGDVILVEQDSWQDTRYIDSNSWNLPRILPWIVAYPSEWTDPPRVYRLRSAWQSKITYDIESPILELGAETVSSPTGHFRTIELDRAIIIQGALGKLMRVNELSLDNGELIQFKSQQVSQNLCIDTNILYNYLIGDSPVCAK